ncbi:MAG: Ubiquinone biosynthesis O-methyltransferase [Flavobacteriia bacterium]|nr:MAG: Ubiquinone biosynthesis O-methyltransferase [Flavobacteriia bacterium]
MTKEEIKSKILAVSKFERVEELKRLLFIVEEINRDLRYDTSRRILEVGCGNGNVSRGIASMGYQVLGVDIDKESIELARSNNPLPNLNFRAEAAEDLKEHGSFDAIVCTEVLEHLDDPTVVLNYVKENLRPGGLFISTVPNGFGPRELLMTKPQQFLQKNGMGDGLLTIKRALGYGHGTVQSSNPDLEHVQFFSKARIVGLHREAGFRLLKFGHGEFISSVFPYSIFSKRSESLQKLDNKVSDLLPSFLSSGFYMSFALE